MCLFKSMCLFFCNMFHATCNRRILGNKFRRKWPEVSTNQTLRKPKFWLQRNHRGHWPPVLVWILFRSTSTTRKNRFVRSLTQKKNIHSSSVAFRSRRCRLVVLGVEAEGKWKKQHQILSSSSRTQKPSKLEDRKIHGTRKYKCTADGNVWEHGTQQQSWQKYGWHIHRFFVEFSTPK